MRTKQTLNLTNYKYLYLEGIFKGTYTHPSYGVPFGQLDVCIFNFFTTGIGYKNNFYLPISNNYIGVYVDITGNEWSDNKVGISPKMKGDAVRLMKFTNIKPDGTYLGSLSDLNN